MWYKKIVFFILLLSCHTSLGQGIRFEKVIDTLGCYYAFDVKQYPDNGYILSGVSHTANYAQQATVIRTDSLGNIIWIKQYGGTLTDGAVASIVQADSSITVLALKDQYSSTLSKTWLINLDQNGNINWQQDYIITSGSNEPSGFFKCKDKGYIITGNSNTSTAGLSSYLLKVDSLGSQIWSKSYDYLGVNNSFSCIEDLSGGYLFAGGDGAIYNQIYVVKTDSIGDTLWTKEIGGALTDIGYSIRQMNDSTLIVAGITYTTTNNYDIYVVKLDQNGNIIWSKQIGDQYENTCKSIEITSDGGFIVGGTTMTANMNYQALAIKLNANGDSIWVGTFGGSNQELGENIIECSDGGFAITGETDMAGLHESMYFVKMNENGSLNKIEEIKSSSTINIYPNPVIDLINFFADNNFTLKVDIRVSDITGNVCIHLQNILINDFQLDISMLKSGLYIINIEGTQFKYNTKFIKIN